MKIINVVIAVGTAIIVGSLLQLGIKAFYPEPVSPWENRSYGYTKPMPAYDVPCDTTDKDCISKRELDREAFDAEQKKFSEEDKAYNDAMKVYNRDVFIIANIVGLLLFALGFWMIFKIALVSQAAPIGIMMAGFWGIMYGYGRGWGSVGDQAKFVIGLLVAVVLIGGSIFLMQKYANRGE